MSRVTKSLLTALIVVWAPQGRAESASPPATLPPLVEAGEIAAPVSDVWRWLATSEGVMEWMVPKAEIDLSILGEYRTHYDPNGTIGDPQTIVNEILAFEPERMLALRTKKAPADFPFAEAAKGTWSVIYLDPCGESCTRFRMVGLGYRDTESGRAMRAFFEQGNGWTLGELQKRAATLQPAASPGAGAPTPSPEPAQPPR
jgi:uncharacterized protein YndB with AHSA1/START domain